VLTILLDLDNLCCTIKKERIKVAVLTWIKSKKTFLKIQEGIGDNLLREDRDNGYIDYVLWSIFRPIEIDLDSELEMECLESGMVMGKEAMSAKGAIPDCYYDAFRVPYDEMDVVELMEEGI
jgi:hypothetical protein